MRPAGFCSSLTHGGLPIPSPGVDGARHPSSFHGLGTMQGNQEATGMKPHGSVQEEPRVQVELYCRTLSWTLSMESKNEEALLAPSPPASSGRW